MGSSREKVLLVSTPGLGGGSELVTRSFVGAEVWGEVDDLVERDTCSVQVDSDTVCSSSVDRLFEVFVWQVLRFEGLGSRVGWIFFGASSRQCSSRFVFRLFLSRAAMFVCCFELAIAMPMVAIVTW